MFVFLPPLRDPEPQWMTDLSKHLEPVLEEARSIEKRREKFYESYKTWLRVSKTAIVSTTEISDKIVDNNRQDNYVSAGTAATGITGGVMGIIAACTAVPTGGASLLLTGGILATGSAVVAAGSNIRKNAINKSLCEEAVKNLEENKEFIIAFNEECKSYFEALDNFYLFFNSISGNDVALALFYEAAFEEGLSFLDDVKLDRWSRIQIRSAFERIIEYDTTVKFNPQMWSAEFMRNSSIAVKSLAMKILKAIREIKAIIESDLYLSRILRTKFRDFLMRKLTSIRMSDARQTLQKILLSTKTAVAIPSISSAYLNIRSSFNEMSTAIRVSLVALNAVFVVIGIINLRSTIINLQDGSQSEESKNITEAVMDLMQARENIIEEIEKCFGW